MTMHTPGPWSTGTQGGDGQVVYVGADMMFVPGSGPVTKANAELIANAPKLKAILEGFLGTLDTPDNSHAHHYFNENIALFTLAIETIKELRGEAEGVSVMENCASCDQQNSDEHCIGHHDLAQGTIYAKCQDGCQDEEA